VKVKLNLQKLSSLYCERCETFEYSIFVITRRSVKYLEKEAILSYRKQLHK
jgi:hypothetical protein